MFQSLPDAPAGSDPVDRPDYRKLETRRGDYFVPWSPEHVAALIRAEALRPDELAMTDGARRHRLVKDLFLLGLRDEMGRGGPSVITRYARALAAAAI